MLIQQQQQQQLLLLLLLLLLLIIIIIIIIIIITVKDPIFPTNDKADTMKVWNMLGDNKQNVT